MTVLAEVLDLTQERFKKISPPSLNFDSEKGFAIQLLANNSYLANIATNCPSSLQQALTNVAAIGLSLNPAKKQAYLITRTVKTKDGKYQARIFLEPSYMGLCDMATQSGCIDWVQANVVYSTDTYESQGPGEKPIHKFNPFLKESERGEFIGAYCVAKTSKGDHLTTELSAEKIFDIRDRSEAWKAGQKGPWKTDFVEMAKKTVIRNAFKTWPKAVVDDRMSQAVHISNENEAFEPIITEPNARDFNVEQKTYFDQLIETSDALGMFSFSKTIDVPVFTNLYHSFPKGSKGKYQSIVDGLMKKGAVDFNTLFDEIAQAIDQNDSMALGQAIEEINADTLEMVRRQLNTEQNSIFEELRG